VRRSLARPAKPSLCAPGASHCATARTDPAPDLLRQAVQEAICPSVAKRANYPQAVYAIKSEMTIPVYCKRIGSPSFWGGEAELLVLVTMLRVPIVVYLPEGGGAYPAGYYPLVTYGEEFQTTKAGKQRRPVKLLYNGHNQCAPAGAAGDDSMLVCGRALTRRCVRARAQL
jgi:hypothetical protein